MGSRCLLLTPEGAGCSVLLLPPFPPCPNIFLRIPHNPSRSLLPPQRTAKVSTAGVREPECCLLETQGRGKEGGGWQAPGPPLLSSPSRFCALGV